MQNPLPNPCVICGKERIVKKTWTEYIGINLLTHIDTICPDPVCQKITDELIISQREKRAAIELNRIQQKEERARLIAAK